MGLIYRSREFSRPALSPDRPYGHHQASGSRARKCQEGTGHLLSSNTDQRRGAVALIPNRFIFDHRVTREIPSAFAVSTMRPPFSVRATSMA